MSSYLDKKVSNEALPEDPSKILGALRKPAEIVGNKLGDAISKFIDIAIDTLFGTK